VAALRLVDLGEATSRGHVVEAVTVAEHARHRYGTGELPEVPDGTLTS